MTRNRLRPIVGAAVLSLVAVGCSRVETQGPDSTPSTTGQVEAAGSDPTSGVSPGTGSSTTGTVPESTIGQAGEAAREAEGPSGGDRDQGVPAGIPTGIYLLGRTDDHSTVAAADLAFIDGYAARMTWRSLDKGIEGPEYDFSAIDSLIGDLQALEHNIDNRMRLTLAIFVREPPPYVLETAETFTGRGPDGPATLPVPWDGASLGAFEDLMANLAAHQVMDAVSGERLALSEHPAVGQIDAGVIGLQGVRDVDRSVLDLPTYDRDLLIGGVLSSYRAVQDAFPATFVYMGFFAINDGIRQPTLSEALLLAIAAEFDGTTRPAVGIFQELLTGVSPRPEGTMGTNLVTHTRNGGFVMFQACGSWRRQGPCEFAAGDDTPANGFELGFETYGARYFEIYLPDITHPGYRVMFEEWHDILWR